MARKNRITYYAVHRGEIIPCHLIARKDRDGRGKYAANSKRDKRRFPEAFTTIEEARDKAVQYQVYMSQLDTF